MLERYSVLDGRIAHSDAGTIPVDVYVMPDGEERAFLTDAGFVHRPGRNAAY